MRSLPWSRVRLGLLILAVAAVALPLGPSHTLAAQTTGTAVLFGRVVDDSGASIPGALLRLSGTAFREESDSAGGFAFRDLPPGTYSLRANYVGYRPLEVAGIELHVGDRHEVVLALQGNTSPKTIRPMLGRPPGSMELTIRMYLNRRAVQLGWPPLRDSPPADGTRELRLEFGGGMIYGPQTVIRLVVTPDSAFGEVREVWRHVPGNTGPYSVPVSRRDWCTETDSTTSVCRIPADQFDWGGLADSAERLGIWESFIEEGVRREHPGLSDAGTLIAEASIDGAYRSVSYYAPGSFSDEQTKVLLAIESLFRREVSRVSWVEGSR